ncbi:malic enzyme [Candidatus Vidania fulgoroideae]|uniref:Malic enzyme n=1 Tax=Candidatus Vidania fulgoroideorum TaxID=881286 RepID=A0A974X988_9PROT|nr:malic enzyme [Candidatus Vidania fulgoroideae]
MKKKTITFHRYPIPGKISTTLIKEIKNKKDLSMAYTPGVGYISLEISNNKDNVYKYTNKGNLVAVITNGTAVLGLGDIGPLASKPVMEGKCALFKKFSKIDSYDIEINENNPKKLVKIISSLEKTFGGINLEDIKSPECFYVERECKKKVNIPVFHDDQHGTAVVVAAALLNSLKITKREISKIKTVVIGAGAAATACLKMLSRLGLRRKNTYIFDIEGLITKDRKIKNNTLKKFSKRDRISIKQSLIDCDFLLGLSSGNVVRKNEIANMSKNAVIFALANPVPEILPEDIREVRNDVVIATGRSDYPNQVNNVLCFPYIFRAALDARVKNISSCMKLETVHSISKLGISDIEFSREKILPDIFDSRLLEYIPYKIMRRIIKEKENRLDVDLVRYKKFLKRINEED